MRRTTYGETRPKRRSWARTRAGEIVFDQARFVLNTERWEAFQLALSSPPVPTPRLAKLLREPSVFDRGSL